MAGMFYSLEEAAKKLGRTEEEVKLLATEGKLREFRDGSIVMFKIDEVDALAAESGLEIPAEEDLALDAELSADTDDLEQFLDLESLGDEEAESKEESPVEEPELESDLDLEPVAEAETLEDDFFGVELEAESGLEAEEQPLEGDVDDLQIGELESELEETPELREDLDALLGLDEEPLAEEADAEEPSLEAEPQDDMLLEEELGLVGSGIDMEASEDDLSDTLMAGASETPDAGEASQDDVLLAEATGTEAAQLTDMDTALTGEGINVLGESDADFKLTDDTLAETLAGLGATGETSLEEIEDDINLDSFGGSGSGLLDLSLQADDTSLGGILDEIYTTEEEGAGADEGLGSADEVTAEADSLISQSKLEASVEDDFIPAAVLAPRAVAELPPDSSSNLLGSLLFLPLILMTFTTLVTLAGLGGFSPPLIGSIAGFFWYIMGGLAVIGLVLGIVGIVGTGSGEAKPKKEKKAKKEKAPKQKKEKKPKKEKKKK